MDFSHKDFGQDFLWGVAVAATQIEGAADCFGKGKSIWDSFAERRWKIKKGARPDIACDFYSLYAEDILLTKELGFKVFRFSIAWSRIFPNGDGQVNQKGVRFYHDVLDTCLQHGLVPYVTLYHWDLPQALEDMGGWTNYTVTLAFNNYVQYCCRQYGDKVKNWIIVNEPFGFTSLGYLLGLHAPGRTGLGSFFNAVFHTALAQAQGGAVVRAEVSGANIGTSFSCSYIKPYSTAEEDVQAAARMDLMMNRLFIEPALGMGFPEDGWALMEKFNIEHSSWRWKERLAFNFDFIGLQNYFPVTVKHSPLVPYINAWQVSPKSMGRTCTDMGWEQSGEDFYNIIMQYAAYENMPPLMITEGGAYFNDTVQEGRVHDAKRITYFKEYLRGMKKAMDHGADVRGYLVWTLMDNFEWAEGYEARFGLIYTDFSTQERIIKDSGRWWKSFMAD